MLSKSEIEKIRARLKLGTFDYTIASPAERFEYDEIANCQSFAEKLLAVSVRHGMPGAAWFAVLSTRHRRDFAQAASELRRAGLTELAALAACVGKTKSKPPETVADRLRKRRRCTGPVPKPKPASSHQHQALVNKAKAR
jgi:hypothetical protein